MPASVNTRWFVDTNVWLYAFIESDDPAKSAAGRQLLQMSRPVVSTQVINEVCVNLLRRAIFAEEQIRGLIKSFYDKYEVVELTQEALLRAVNLREHYSVSFWDSLIVATALESGVEVLHSEDMQHGLVIDGKLRIHNPFVS